MDLKWTAVTLAVAFLAVTLVNGQGKAGQSKGGKAKGGQGKGGAGQGGQNKALTQAEVDNIARNLEIHVYMGTQHFNNGKHVVQISLKNTGRALMLKKDNWAIMFSLKQKLFPGVSNFSAYGLSVRRYVGSNYIITPDALAKTPFRGIKPNEYVAFTIPGEGLSVFRDDVYPNWVIMAGDDVTAKTIASTADDKLGFVRLHAQNRSKEDMSAISGLMRTFLTQEAIDQMGVPTSTVFPAPAAIALDQNEPIRIVNMANSQKWFIWAAPQVSANFVSRLNAAVSSLPNMTGKVEVFTPSPAQKQPPQAPGYSVIYVMFKAVPGSTDDYYRLAVGNNNFDFIHITAQAEEGFFHALASLESIFGLYTVLPHCTITDDARYPVRSVMLDVTSNFFPKTSILRFLELMRMYKLNNLVLKLADDSNWRLAMPRSMDFDELTTFASKRCADKTKCLSPAFGSGADDTTSGSGFYTIDDFIEILREAANLNIKVTPMINFMGGMKAAQMAAHKRYMRLNKVNKAEADRLHIMSTDTPNVPDSAKSPETVYTDSVLDPCNQPTEHFITEVVNALKSIYTGAEATLLELHAGGDDATAYMNFAKCADPQRKMMSLLQKALPATASLRVNEQAVTDPNTKFCLTPANGYRHAAITVDFMNIAPGDHTKWGLTKDMFNYLNDTVAPANFTTITDPLKPTNFSKLGVAPWSKSYVCANMDYKVVLGPDMFFDLSTAYEPDFYEKGHRKMDYFATTNLHRQLVFEPENLHASADMGTDRLRHIPYRLCKVFECTKTLPEKKANIRGLRASVYTPVIRNEESLWHLVAPRIMHYAQRAWRQSLHENILDPTNVTTLTNLSSIQHRAGMLDLEVTQTLNNFVYKELGRLEARNITYRVSRPGASIYFGLVVRRPGPYPVMVKADLPVMDGLVQYRPRFGADRSWRTMFTRNETTGEIIGGVQMPFPLNANQSIDIRILSANRQRSSIPTTVLANTDNLLPKVIPVDLTAGACLNVMNPEKNKLEKIKPAQWNTIMGNIPRVMQDEMQFMQTRAVQLETAFQNALARRQRSRTRTPTGIPGVPDTPANMQQAFMGIEAMMVYGQNITQRPADDVYKNMFETERAIMTRREESLKQRIANMHNDYLACPDKSASTP